MSLADYGMLKLASTSLIAAKKRVRSLTQWYSKAMKATRAEYDNAKQAKRAVMQKVDQSIFYYQQKMTPSMEEAQKNNGQTEYMMALQLLTQKNAMAQAYKQQYDSYLEDILHKYQDAIDELEADKKEELEDAKNDVTYWEQVKKEYAQNYKEGVKEMWGNQA